MYHLKGYRRLNRTKGHRKALLKNLLANLIEKEKIVTSVAKAKELRRFAEKTITLAKQKKYAELRKVVNNKEIFKKLPGLSSRYVNRNGGYTRIIKKESRPGDKCSQAIISFLE